MRLTNLMKYNERHGSIGVSLLASGEVVTRGGVSTSAFTISTLHLACSAQYLEVDPTNNLLIFDIPLLPTTNQSTFFSRQLGKAFLLHDLISPS